MRRGVTGILGGIVLAACGCGAAGDDAGSPPPASAPAAPPPKAAVLLVPGSAFQGATTADAEKLAIAPETWRAWGFAPAPTAYARGRTGLRELEAQVRDARAAHPDLPLCLYGESSGGTWALLVAARDPEIACVIAAAAPVDEDTWRRSRSRVARYAARAIWRRYFGSPSKDDRFEPLDVWRAARPTVPVFLLYAQSDRVVPAQQGRILSAAAPRAQTRFLAPGPRRFVHSGVAPRQLRRALADVRAFVASSARR